ncbi:MAG: cysteine desulfurase family protein [Lachnospiraceae bacterium]|nr:cysteine desulfurase family protein [Lachnospiraceae bacterium]MEE3460745.1 cysteine desulfurase family protein [Lachnospiraceae bacterium]
MTAYLDNAATTQTSHAAVEIMERVLSEDYGNPSSKHRMGIVAEDYLIDSRKIIADSLKVKPQNIIFTSGGTESNNQALIGTVLANKRKGKRVVTTCYEHSSILEPSGFLEREGFEVVYVKIFPDGHVDMDALKDALDDQTVLVSVMAVNNEIGAINDIASISRLVRDNAPRAYLHVDAIQAYGKYRLDPKKLGIDLLSVSSHKIHGPKGTGFLYVREGIKIFPYIYGGGQERLMRSGTQNVPGIAGFGLAVKEIYHGFEEHIENMYELKKYLISELLKIDGVHINGLLLPSVSPVHSIESDYEQQIAAGGVPCEPEKFSGNELSILKSNADHSEKGSVWKSVNDIAADHIKDTAPHIVSASFEGIRAEVLLNALSEKGIYVSSGSACSSNRPDLSGTLKAIGIADDLLDRTLRFSFSCHTTKEEIDAAVSALGELLPVLRRFVHK